MGSADLNSWYFGISERNQKDFFSYFKSYIEVIPVSLVLVCRCESLASGALFLV